MQIGPDVVTVGSFPQYVGWNTFSEEIFKCLETFNDLNIIKEINRLGIRYINFFTDFGFKKLFGSEPGKELLIDFLNELLKGREKPIKTLNFKKSEHLGASEIDRRAIFDLYCESETGEKFIVELQKAKQKFFKDRSIFYSTFPIQEQAGRKASSKARRKAKKRSRSIV